MMARLQVLHLSTRWGSTGRILSDDGLTTCAFLGSSTYCTLYVYTPPQTPTQEELAKWARKLEQQRQASGGFGGDSSEDNEGGGGASSGGHFSGTSSTANDGSKEGRQK
jgi:uncharacterized membrane protein YgcG